MLVPELYDAWITKGLADRSARGTEVGHDDGLPHDEYTDIGFGIPGDELAECGGPPHADGSGGREGNDEAGLAFGFIEGAAEIGRGGFAKRAKRRIDLGR
jgi:hypothetical protein